jgi:hypothetical protein
MTASARPTAQPLPTFKACSNCDQQWNSIEIFMQDPGIRLVGYMPTFDDLLRGLFLFNHVCGTTLACTVGQFEHLYDGPIYEINRHGDQECPGYCLNQSELSACPQQCSCAFVRETLQIINHWPKAGAA